MKSKVAVCTMNLSIKHMNCHEDAASHRGMMLIEVSVAVALSTIVLGLVVSVAVALKQMDRRMQNRGVERQRQLELAELVRTDIRSATGIALSEDTTLIIKGPGERETRYEIRSEGIQRMVQMPDGTANV